MAVPTPTPAPRLAVRPSGATGSAARIGFSSQGTPQELAMFEEILKGFEERNPRIRVERKLDPSLTWEKVPAMLGAGTAASLQRTRDADIFMLLAQRAITGLDDQVRADLKRDEYYPSTWESRVGAGGEIGAILIASSPMVIFYNVDHFREAGLTPATDWASPWSFEQLNEALRKLVRRDTSGKVTRYAYAEDTWFMQPLMVNNGAEPYNADETECTLLKTGAAEEILAWQQGLFVKEQVAMPYTENHTQLFNAGRLSINVRHTSFAPAIKELNYDVMPIFKGKLKNMTENSERCWTIPAGEPSKDEAWQLGRYLWGEEAQGILARTDFAVPMMRRIAEGQAFTDPGRGPKNRKIYGQGVAADVYTHNNPLGDDYQQWFSRTAGELTSGQKDPRSFLKERVDRLNEGLRTAGWSRKSGWVKGWTPGEGVKLLVKPRS
ncbi:MAG TPA: extracellular solute-binding protein [Chloroflexota bacterium]